MWFMLEFQAILSAPDYHFLLFSQSDCCSWCLSHIHRMNRISEWSAPKQQHFSCSFVVKFAVFSVDHFALIKSEGSFTYL
jgi:hypothetical protein